MSDCLQALNGYIVRRLQSACRTCLMLSERCVLLPSLARAPRCLPVCLVYICVCVCVCVCAFLRVLVGTSPKVLARVFVVVFVLVPVSLYVCVYCVCLCVCVDFDEPEGVLRLLGTTAVVCVCPRVCMHMCVCVHMCIDARHLNNFMHRNMHTKAYKDTYAHKYCMHTKYYLCVWSLQKAHCKCVPMRDTWKIHTWSCAHIHTYTHTYTCRHGQVYCKCIQMRGTWKIHTWSCAHIHTYIYIHVQAWASLLQMYSNEGYLKDSCMFLCSYTYIHIYTRAGVGKFTANVFKWGLFEGIFGCCTRVSRVLWDIQITTCATCESPEDEFNESACQPVVDPHWFLYIHIYWSLYICCTRVSRVLWDIQITTCATCESPEDEFNECAYQSVEDPHWFLYIYVCWFLTYTNTHINQW